MLVLFRFFVRKRGMAINCLLPWNVCVCNGRKRQVYPDSFNRFGVVIVMCCHLCLTSYKKCQSCFPLLIRIIFWRDWTLDSHKEMIFLVFALTYRNSIGGEKPLSMRLLKLYGCSCYVNVPAWFIARQNYQRESCRILWGSSQTN